MAPDPKLYEHLANKDRMLQGFPYDPYTEELVSLRAKGKSLLREYNNADESQGDRKKAILKEVLHPDSADDVYVEPNFRVDYGCHITFGEKAYMNYDCCILDVAPVVIGKNFMAGPGVHIYTATHPTDVQERREYEFGKAVTIGDDVWVGGMAVICPGVTIGNGVTIGAGSVVTKDVPDYCVVAGNPARIIKRVDKPVEDKSK